MPLLCLASPKGGVGKTTLAADLAWELARLGADDPGLHAVRGW